MGKAAEPRILMTGLAIGESPRWHEGRLWLCNWGTREVIAVDGNSEVTARVPTTLPFCIDWLPDGHLLVVSGPEARLLRQEPDGTLVTYAVLNGLADTFNKIVVDWRGNAYVNGGSFDFATGAGAESGVVALVRPDGSVWQVADNIAFGNGMVITEDGSTLIVAESCAGRLSAFDIDEDDGLSNRRVWADLGDGAPDGICIDDEGTPACFGSAHLSRRLSRLAFPTSSMVSMPTSSPFSVTGSALRPLICRMRSPSSKRSALEETVGTFAFIRSRTLEHLSGEWAAVMISSRVSIPTRFPLSSTTGKSSW